MEQNGKPNLAARTTALIAARAPFLILTATFLSVAASAGLGLAATPEEIKKRREAETLIKSAEANYRDGKFEEAGKQIAEVQPLLNELSQVREFGRLVSNLAARVRQTHAMLELEGVAIEPLKLPAPGDAKSAGSAGDGAAGVSFTNEIAPILVAKCGRCHVTDNKGQFSMASFAMLKKGPPEGIVVMPGSSQGSRLVEVIETGDMPRGNLKVTAEELAALKRWIDEGAKYDGRDEQTALTALARAPNRPSPEPSPAPPMISKPTGQETVRFALELAPVLAENCLDCHSGNQARGQLRLDSFAAFARGGDSGPAWTPGNGADSLIVKKLRGTAGARMPLNRPALDDAVIAKFETWVNEGARFDGENPNQNMQLLAALTRTKSLSHEELSADRAKSSQQKYRLALPTLTPGVVETKNFYIMGAVSQSTLDEAAKAAEQQAASLGRYFRVPSGEPLLKGRITLFLVPTGYAYREFGQMVEERQLPDAWRGHSYYDVMDAYGVVVPPTESDDYSLAGILAQQIAGVYIASLGSPPAWFVEGSARAQAARVDPRSKRTRQWNERLRALGQAGGIERFLERKLAPEDNDIAAYGFVRTLMSGNKYPALLVSLRNGEEFEAAFTRHFGPLPNAASAGGRAGGRR